MSTTDYPEGGYKDINTKMLALKVTWVTRQTLIFIFGKPLQTYSFQTFEDWQLFLILA